MNIFDFSPYTSSSSLQFLLSISRVQGIASRIVFCFADPGGVWSESHQDLQETCCPVAKRIVDRFRGQQDLLGGRAERLHCQRRLGRQRLQDRLEQRPQRQTPICCRNSQGIKDCSMLILFGITKNGR